MQRWAQKKHLSGILLLLVFGIFAGCSAFGNQASATPTFVADPTQPTAPTGFPAQVPMPPSATFQAQTIAITLPLNIASVTTNQTWIWTSPTSQANLIAYYRNQLPKMGWTNLTDAIDGDGPALSACGAFSPHTTELIDIEAADTIAGTDSVNVSHTYTAPPNGAVLIIGIIPTASCASVI